MKKTQTGFTLIELMIVVAIIGILAALAIPAYTDYTIRTKVAEGASLSGPAKAAVDIFYSENGTLTGLPGHGSLGLSAAGSYNAQYTSAVQVNGDATITVTLATNTELGEASGDTFVYTPTAQGGNLEWAVSASSIPLKYLPRD